MSVWKDLRAKLNRTFVTECPNCHKSFYGFEKWHQNVVLNKDGKKVNFRYVCHDCYDQVKKDSLATGEK